MSNQPQCKKTILIVGCGKIGLRVAKRLSEDHTVWAIRRSLMNDRHINFIQADITQTRSLEKKLPEHIDYVIYCLSPDRSDETSYRDVFVTGLSNVLTALKGHSEVKHFIFISSTSVYHQDDHSMVDEQSPTQPTRFSGQILLEAEALVQTSSLPSSIVRFSGIYGGQRSQLIDSVKTGRAKYSQTSRLTNRIHEDDCVGFLLHLISNHQQNIDLAPCYLATDSEPAEFNDVIRYISEQLGTTLSDAKDSSAQGSSRRSGNKLCQNTLMLTTGYQLKYPSYREGYSAMLKSFSGTDK